MTVAVRLAQARRQLAEQLQLPGLEARIEAQMLMQRALGNVTRAWLIAHEDEAVTQEDARAFQALLERRLAGEPVAYILGVREFFGLEFEVGPDVLIPRPDTETLVEAALRHIPEEGACRVLDLGTGSGAIAIAVAVHRPHAEVLAVDVSAASLALARRNARRLGVTNVHFLQGDWCASIAGQTFDVIVSNPPYIAEGDAHLTQGDLRFEPGHALSSGADGLDDIRRIARDAGDVLAPGGCLLLEHGYDQAAQVAEWLRACGYSGVGHEADLAGILRVTFGRRPG